MLVAELVATGNLLCCARPGARTGGSRAVVTRPPISVSKMPSSCANLGGRSWDRTSDPSLVRRNQDENHTRSQNSYICVNCENSARRSLRMSARVSMVLPESGSRSTSQDRNTGSTSPHPPHDSTGKPVTPTPHRTTTIGCAPSFGHSASRSWPSSRGSARKASHRSIVPTGWTPAGMLEHLGGAEWHWFQGVVAGKQPELPGDVEEDQPPYDPTTVVFATDASSAKVLAFYRDQCAASESVLATTRLSARPRCTHGQYEPPNVRWVVLHMIEETARHAGHLDLARELLDGEVRLGGR